MENDSVEYEIISIHAPKEELAEIQKLGKTNNIQFMGDKRDLFEGSIELQSIFLAVTPIALPLIAKFIVDIKKAYSTVRFKYKDVEISNINIKSLPKIIREVMQHESKD